MSALVLACTDLGSTEIRRRNVMPDIRVFRLDTNGCTPQLTHELADKGFVLTTSRREGTLRVNVRQLDANTGASARFSAKLRDRDGGVVWETTGREDSISQEELCEDLSEEIVERLENRMEAIG